MDRAATRELIESKDIKLSSWCRRRGLSAASAYAVLSRSGKVLETRNQVKFIEALIAEGLYVASDDEGVSIDPEEV